MDLKTSGAEEKDIDYKKMTDGLMREMFWAQPPTTIEMFTIKAWARLSVPQSQ